jgi:hypothetical protein
MRWRTSPPVPKPGDVRTICRFALFPIHIGAETVWLENYAVHQIRMEGVEGVFWADDRYSAIESQLSQR